jgi:glyceraldehyde 3-phosphate dehydrogenase (phosphorylating)
MSIKIGINGLGRIGRCIIRAIYEYDLHDFEIVTVNGPAPIETHIHLLKYDSVHGQFNADITATDNGMEINGKTIKVTHERDPKKLGWDGVDIVFECTGRLKTKNEAKAHLDAGAKKVIISAPSPDADATLIYGVNHNEYRYSMDIISIGSCTTNALAPLAKILSNSIGIDSGFMTTIHAYTNDQRVLDGTHKDLRRARSCAVSIIPTSTGAAKAIGLVIPALKGKIDGAAVRVPTQNVSMIDLVFNSARKTTAKEIINLVSLAASKELKGILAIAPKNLVSIDFNHNPNSSIFDQQETRVVNDTLCRVVAWYDNEWGFSNRMLDIAKFIMK